MKVRKPQNKKEWAIAVGVAVVMIGTLWSSIAANHDQSGISKTGNSLEESLKCLENAKTQADKDKC